MRQQDKEGKRLKRQIRYLLKTTAGRLALEDRPKLLRAIGRFAERMKFESFREGGAALGIKPAQFGFALESYRKLAKAERAGAHSSPKRLRLARVKVVDDLATKARPTAEYGLIQMELGSGVKVSVGSTDAAIELLDRLEQRKKARAA